MDEKSAVKAPVTRLRRRLSEEQSEDVKSPGPVTPTKKRGGRLAAKPQLELIDENEPNGSTKRSTRKTSVKVNVGASEDKPVTPSRRNMRIKSNTSLVSETIQSFESPRALRAARRNSQIGSDSESSVTPVRQTRRTRKDSTSSIENLEVTLSAKTSQITEKIIEEDNTDVLVGENIISPKKTNNSLVDSSLLLVKELDVKHKIKSSNLNKSTSALENHDSLQKKRQRAKSWTITSQTQNNVGAFFSDNEITKKNLKKRTSKGLSIETNHTGSGDSANNDQNSIQNTDNKTQPELDTSIQKNNNIEKIYTKTSKEFLSPNKSVNSENKSSNKENIIQSSQDNINESTKTFEKAFTAKVQSTVYFDDSSADSKDTSNVKTQVGTEDQCVPVIHHLVESNLKENSEMTQESAKKNDFDNSCEPMDIDETMPHNVSLSEYAQTNFDKSSDKLGDIHDPKTASTLLVMDNTLNTSSNKAKRKSSLSHSHNLEKSETENKTTLILSQIKDVSSTEDSISKSPIPNNDILSQSVGSAGPTKETLNKKNLSHDYSTSTPLQQKKFQKLAMQINSSITDSSSSEYKKEKVRNAAIEDVSQKSNKPETTSDDDSDSEIEEESSKDESGLLDDEAEEASDDYESGDSQDDEERQYEKENQILEKGETLESDDDVSNDSDYEKDSFVVSSDEEDNDLLSGSGDDLSMSDKELSMSKKSKKKYDERKQKEQKKASREMFEARHKLNTSDATAKAKKLNKRQQIESSEESEQEEVAAPLKRNRHLRLDSTQEEDLDQSSANKSITKKDSKAKRLSESKHNESAIQETEITTVCDKSVLQHDNDPLSVQIKLEQKTPKKDFNISTVQINENIEEVQVDNNASVMNTNETMDPLQATMLAEEDSSMSENSEIANNYDSILKELNSANKTKKTKTLDTSLNLNKKTKQNPKEPIVDQLNLTNTKTSKKKEKVLGEDAVHSAEVNRSQNKEKSADRDAESSDSIDLQLLFSEESNDNNEVDDETTKYEKPKETDADEFIPLKRTPGMLNILTSDDKNELSESTLNESTKKKNKKLKSQKAYEEPTGEANDNEIHIIIDTQGTYNSQENLDMTKERSVNRKRNSITENKAPLISDSVAAIDKDDEAPLEVPYESTKSKKKNRNSSETNVERQDKTETSFNISQNTNSAKKKKKRVSESHIENTEETGEAVLQVCNSSIESDKQKKNIIQVKITSDDIVEEKNDANVSVKMGSEKKKKKKLSETLAAETSDIAQEKNDANVSIKMGSEKKKKRLSETLAAKTSDIAQEKNDANVSIKMGSEKKKKRLSETLAAETSDIVKEKNDANVSIKMGSEKKKKKMLSETLAPETSDIAQEKNDANVSIKMGSEKKKKRLSETLAAETSDIAQEKNDANVSIKMGSEKKKKRLSETLAAETSDIAQEKNDANVSIKMGSEKKKKRLSETLAAETSDIVEEKNNANVSVKMGSEKKKKKRLSETHAAETSDIVEEKNDANVSVKMGSEKKKKKRLSETLAAETSDIAQEKNDANVSIKMGSEKKKKRLSETLAAETSDIAQEKNDANVSIKMGSEKKKKRLSETLAAETSDIAQEKNDANVSIKMGSEKKKKNRLSETLAAETSDIVEEKNDANVSVKMGSEKKKKKLYETLAAETSDIVEEKNDANVSVKMCSEKKKKRLSETLVAETSDTVLGDHQQCLTKSKKRKRKSPANELVDNASTEDPDPIPCSSKVAYEASPNANQKKKQKISQKNGVPIIQDAVPKEKNKKRKERDDEDENRVSKIFKENSSDKVRITRLPSSVLNQLEDRPRKRYLDSKRSNLGSTTSFIVEDIRKARNIPSKFLEESVYLNDTHIEEKPKRHIKKPKVLPFIPTAVTSCSGVTTNFKISVIPKEVKFMAQTTNVTNFKNEYLYGSRIKRVGTYENYKKNRKAKLSKF